jgi:hypothetical protein
MSPICRVDGDIGPYEITRLKILGVREGGVIRIREEDINYLGIPANQGASYCK